MAARAPFAPISGPSRIGAAAASTWKVTEPQPASTYSRARLSGSSIMRCTSRGTSVLRLSASTIVGPKVRLGTKWLSITSTCTQSALPMRATSSPSRAKSALRMLGVIWMPTGSSLGSEGPGGGHLHRAATLGSATGGEVARAAPPSRGLAGSTSLDPRGDPGADQLGQQVLEDGRLVPIPPAGGFAHDGVRGVAARGGPAAAGRGEPHLDPATVGPG